MAMLDQLMALPGVLAAFEFHGNGKLLIHQSANERLLNTDTMKLLAHMCAANINIAAMQARGWDANPETRGFFPVQTFTLIGLEWSVIVSGTAGETDADDLADENTPFVAVVLSNEEGDHGVVFKTMEHQGKSQ